MEHSLHVLNISIKGQKMGAGDSDDGYPYHGLGRARKIPAFNDEKQT